MALSLGSFSLVHADKTEIVLTVDKPTMTVNGVETAIDESGTSPVIIDGRTLVPIRAVIENLGGEVSWDNKTKTAALTYNNDEIKLTIDSKTALFNENEKTLDTAPVIINSRTMLPLRFVAESFGFATDWEAKTKTITVTKAEEADNTSEEPNEQTENTEQNILVVYFTRADNIEIPDDIDAVTSASLNKIDGEIVGCTEIVANVIHKKVGGDIISIEAEELYPTSYDEHVEQADREIDRKARPAVKTQIADFDKYDTVYIGTPIWWGKMPMPMYTFIESYNFDGKTVIPFTTHRGSGMGDVREEIENLMPNANVKQGFAVNGDSAANAKDEILKKLESVN